MTKKTGTLTIELNPVPELPGWLVALIVGLLIAVCDVAMAEEEPMKPGGGVYINGQWNTVEVQQPWQGGE